MEIKTILNFDLSNYLLNLIVFLLIVISIKIIIAKDLLEAVVFTSIFSLLIGLSYLLMDAPDVAMTEAALGACLSTCVYLNLLRKLPSDLKNIQRTKIIPASLVCLLFIITLAYMGFELPNYGDENTPLQTGVTKYYLENTEQDIGIPSFVAAILASYRGYDTLGETSVILIAGISVLFILSLRKDEDVIPQGDHGIQKEIKKDWIPWRDLGMTNPIVKHITAFIAPYIILYSLYIQLNGESSPGGGFQAGVIFASSLIAYDLVYGNQKLNRFFSINIYSEKMKSRYTKINLEKRNRSVSREAERTIVREHSRSYKDDVANLRGSSSILISIAVLGVMIYAITGTISLFFNDHYLNYYSLTNFTNDKLLAQHIGIFAVEIGIGLTVSSVMYLIYTLFSYE